MLEEEYKSTLDFSSSLDGETWKMFERPKVKFEKRNAFIDLLTVKLDKRRITISEFINQVSSKLYAHSNQTVEIDFSDVLSNESEDDLYDVRQPEGNETVNYNICFKNPRNILLQPCNHFKMCSSCFSKLSEEATALRNELLCPFCRQIIQTTCSVYICYENVKKPLFSLFFCCLFRIIEILC